jgi:hypothetical protein
VFWAVVRRCYTAQCLQAALLAVTRDHPYVEVEDINTYADRLGDDACTWVEHMAVQEHARVTERGLTFDQGGSQEVTVRVVCRGFCPL